MRNKTCSTKQPLRLSSLFVDCCSRKVQFVVVAVVIARPGHRTEVGLSGTGSSGQHVNLVGENSVIFFFAGCLFIVRRNLDARILETRVWRKNRAHRHRLLSRLQHLKPWLIDYYIDFFVKVFWFSLLLFSNDFYFRYERSLRTMRLFSWQVLLFSFYLCLRGRRCAINRRQESLCEKQMHAEKKNGKKV